MKAKYLTLPLLLIACFSTFWVIAGVPEGDDPDFRTIAVFVSALAWPCALLSFNFWKTHHDPFRGVGAYVIEALLIAVAVLVISSMLYSMVDKKVVEPSKPLAQPRQRT